MFLQDTKVGDERSFCLKICPNPYKFCIGMFVLRLYLENHNIAVLTKKQSSGSM